MKLTKKQEERFWKKVQKTDSCWLWMGSKNSGVSPHGRVRIDGKNRLTHHISFLLANGYLPAFDGKVMALCHNCGNASCVNPEHLYIGTHKENMQDKKRHGTQPVMDGESNPNSRLKESDVIIIKSRFSETNVAIARDYGVTPEAISRIRIGKTWKNICSS